MRGWPASGTRTARRTRMEGSWTSGEAGEDERRAVAAAGAPDAGAGERRRAGEVEAGYGGRVARQLGLAGAQRGERAAAEAGCVAPGQVELALVDVGGHRPPVDDRLEQAGL